MPDQFVAIEKLARVVALNLGEDYDEMQPDRQRGMRKVGYVIDQALTKQRDETFDDAAKLLEEMMTAPSTPKNWLRGLQEGRGFIKAFLAQRKLNREPFIPDDLVSYLSESDPYVNLTAGDDDPTKAFVGQTCDVEGDGGWSCTRPVHPPHWQHWDSDPDYDEGRIVVTWYGEDGALTSVSDVLEDTGDDDL